MQWGRWGMDLSPSHFHWYSTVSYLFHWYSTVSYLLVTLPRD